MLDIQYIRDHKDVVAKAAKDKNLAFDVEKLLEADRERVRLSQELEELYSLKNDINDLIAKATPEERADILTRAKEIKEKTDELEPRVREATMWRFRSGVKFRHFPFRRKRISSSGSRSIFSISSGVQKLAGTVATIGRTRGCFLSWGSCSTRSAR